MKYPAILAASTIMACMSMSAHANEPSDPATLLNTNCLACHGSNESMDSRLAPPIVAVKDHYLAQFSTKESFVDAIVQWVKKPSEDRAQMKGAVRRFGLMPMLPLSEADLKLIAEFIYDEELDQPGWYEEHYEKEHGKEK